MKKEVSTQRQTFSLRQKLGTIVYDFPSYLWSMRPSSHQAWVYMHNRDERLFREGSGHGAKCNWQWTSDLHIAKVFPRLGHQLMKRALRNWPIVLRDQPARQASQDSPGISFVIGHRGMDRLPNLLATLESIAGQRHTSFECVVVEQSASPEVRDQLPSWVRYLHTPLPYGDMPFARAWAFNVGARAARGKVLVLHDNDMLVPVDYAKEVLERFVDGYEVMNLKRFIFYLSEAHSAAVISSKEPLTQRPPEVVVQNLEAGGSLAVKRDAYFAIGGFDESFVGWGGEDNEFWERAQTRKVWPYGYIPILHLWHAPQPNKSWGEQSSAKERYWQLTRISPETRIEKLRMLPFGRVEGPTCDNYITSSR
jgi:GT2 family glycosyltransferase